MRENTQGGKVRKFTSKESDASEDSDGSIGKQKLLRYDDED